MLLVSLVETGDTSRFATYRLEEKHFFGEEIELFKFLQSHVEKYARLPNPETVKHHFGGLPKTPEPPTFYFDQVQNRFQYKRLNRALTDCNEFMKMQDSWTACNLLNEALNELRANLLRTSISDFGHDAPKMIEAEYKRIKLAGAAPGLMMSWPTLDRNMNGLRDGDILSIIGRPAQGKTFMMLWVAHHIWKSHKARVLVISMEMDRLTIMQRLSAIETGIHVGEIRSGELTTIAQQAFFKKLHKVTNYEGALTIVEGNQTATVAEIFSLAGMYQADILFIDGAYMLRHPDRRFDRYQRVGENISEIKQRCSAMGIPAVLSYQFNREAAKKSKKKGAETGLEDIAHSDAIGQQSSVVLGMMQEETIETMKRREVRIMKGRNGEIGSFNIGWDFSKMDFSEIVEPSTDELKFV